MAAIGPSSLGATLSKAVIPLIPKVKDEDIEKEVLTTYINVGTVRDNWDVVATAHPRTIAGF